MNSGNSQSDIGIAVIMMTDSGPETYMNFSSIDEVASMYLSVKGFTAFLTGFERVDHGPGKIRGILQIPTTELYAIAFDQNMKGLGTEEDARLQMNRVVIFCLIADEDDLKKVRLYYQETEEFLQNYLKDILSFDKLTEELVQKLKNEYKKFLTEKISLQQKSSEKPDEIASIFEISTLLALPRDENLTARAIMDYMINDNKEGVTLTEICQVSNRKKNKEREVLNRLIEKGLIILKPSKEEKIEILYYAK